MLKAYSYAEWAPTLGDFVPAVKGWPQFEGVLEWLTTQDCEGCPAGGGNPECAIRLCAKERGLAGCWECSEDPCEKLREFDQGYAAARENRQRIRDTGLEAWLAEQAAQVLPQVDVVALTGTSLINHTFDDLIRFCRPDAFVLLLGPSAPLSPVLFEAGVDAVSGTWVTDPELVLRSVGQGATFRQIKRAGGLRLLTLVKT